MFRQLARWFQVEQGRETAAEDVFQLHPMQLARFLEEVWERRASPSATVVPRPGALGVPGALSTQELASGIGSGATSPAPLTLTAVPDDIYPGGGDQPALWDHLIYAYMIENTRIVEIFARVLREHVSGERLGSFTSDSQRWLRATEDLFYRDPPPFQIFSLASQARPDLRASRRNAYYRMFGMDLNHGVEDSRAYPYEKPAAANRDFVSVLEELLREVWRGVENFTNTSGPRNTDDAALLHLIGRLQEMLRLRRLNGNLSREEFFFVSMMSWFHLTVESDSPIVRDLQAEAATPDERLRKIGERVGLPAHSRSQSYFELAAALSRVLLMIETGRFRDTTAVQALYLVAEGVINPLRDDMMNIVNHWSLATGRDMKARKVTASPRSPAQTIVPVTVQPSGANGHNVVAAPAGSLS